MSLFSLCHHLLSLSPQALVEVKILDCCLEWDKDDRANIVRMQEFFYFRKHLCITFELLSINLYEFIKNNNFRGFSIGLIRRFAIQVRFRTKSAFCEILIAGL